ncbi:MAG: hypothetical protein QXR09_00955 [Candidatus Aenigmatarchaeota archaeon]
MKKKIGLSFWVGDSFSQILRAIELGCNFLQVSLEFPFLYQKRSIHLLNEIIDNGLEIAFESPQGAVQIFNPIKEISRSSLKIMNKILNFCSKFNPLYFNLHQIIDISTYSLFKEEIEKRKIGDCKRIV